MKTLVISFFVVVTFLLMVPAAINADLLSPKKQLNLGFSNDEVICSDDLVKIIKSTTNKASCVEPRTAEKLLKRGWTESIDQQQIDDMKKKKLETVGKINKIVVTPVSISPGRLQTAPPVGGYNYVFEACVNEQQVVAPEVYIRSDSESKTITLTENIMPDSCVTSAAFIKASDPDSITAQLINKGETSKRTIALEKKVDTLKNDLAKERDNLSKITKEPQQTEDYKKKVSDSSSKIQQLRKDLNSVRAELHRYLFALYMPSKVGQEPITKFSFSGTPIEGETANKLAVTKAIRSEMTYDVVFEACAGEEIVRIPIIEVTSDSASTKVQLGDKISPKTCQKSSVKIEANDPESVQVTTVKNAKSSKKVAELENQITLMQNEIIQIKKSLKEMTHSPQRPSDFDNKVTESTGKISELRDKINQSRGEMQKLLLSNIIQGR